MQYSPELETDSQVMKISLSVGTLLFVPIENTNNFAFCSLINKTEAEKRQQIQDVCDKLKNKPNRTPQEDKRNVLSKPSDNGRRIIIRHHQ